MSFINDTLERGEKITYRAMPSRAAFVIRLIPVIAVSLITMFPMGIRSLFGTELALTDKRILGKSAGKVLVSRHDQIESVTVRQGLLGMVFDYGKVIITLKTGTRTVFKGIAMPLMLQHEIDGAIETATLGHRLSEYESIKF